jgi:hypothetical protein
MMLGEMKVDVVGATSSEVGDGNSNTRLFRRKLLETDEVDQVRELLVLKVITGALTDAGVRSVWIPKVVKRRAASKSRGWLG